MKNKQLLYTIINSILCIGLFVVSIFIFNANIMTVSAAGTSTTPFLRDILFYVTIGFPVVPFIAIVGSWIAYYKKSKKYLYTFILLPWGYVILVIVVLLSFFSLNN